MNGFQNIYYLLRRKPKKEKRKAYSTIYELPILKFNKCIKENNLNHLVIEGRYSKDELLPIWEGIQSEIIIEFGVDENYKRFIRLMKMRSKELIRVWIKGEKYRMAFANIYLERANKIVEKKESNLTENLAIISKAMNSRLPYQEVTVAEYFSYIKLLEKQASQNGKQESNK